MSRGGARNRSGPKADENSERSEQRGYTLTSLPSEGYKGPVPKFPLPDATKRELEVWKQLWKKPQAAAWALPSESWRIDTVGMYVRVKVRCEDPEAPATLFGQLHRFADQIGLTTAGLAEMGWKVAVDETAAAREAKDEPKKRPTSSRNRMRVVNGSGE